MKVGIEGEIRFKSDRDCSSKRCTEYNHLSLLCQILVSQICVNIYDYKAYEALH